MCYCTADHDEVIITDWQRWYVLVKAPPRGMLLVYKTNHSLRATGASSLFTAGVPKKIIQQRSGHLSLQGLRHYERVTQQQQVAVSRVLSSSENTSFDSELEKVSDTPKEPKPSQQPVLFNLLLRWISQGVLWIFFKAMLHRNRAKTPRLAIQQQYMYSLSIHYSSVLSSYS